MQSLSPADLERARFNMIEQQIRPWEVLDPVVLGACGAKTSSPPRTARWPSWTRRSR